MAPPHWTRRSKQKNPLWQLEQPSAFSVNPLTQGDDRCRARGCCAPTPAATAAARAARARAASLASMLTEPVTQSRFHRSSPISTNVPDLIHSSPATSVLSHNSNYNLSATDTIVTTSTTTLSRDVRTLHVSRESLPEKLVHERFDVRSSSKDALSGDVSSCLSLLCLKMRITRARAGRSPSLAHARARQVANRLIRHARYNKTLNESSLCCLSCDLIPVQPVTGSCGHTRCTKCTLERNACPCGTPAPENLHVNTLIQDLIRKFIPTSSSSRTLARTVGVKRGTVCKLSASPPPTDSWRRSRWRGSVRAYWRECRRSTICLTATWTEAGPLQSLISSKSSSRRHREAVPHLVRLAAGAAAEPLARLARALLVQTISELSEGHDPRRWTRGLYRAIRQQAASNWLKPSELECALCYHPFTRPVTTPCGHTYCRTCIERSMDYRKTCALCLRGLDDFNLTTTRDTMFICAALASIDALNPPLPPDPDIIPIFVCTVAYPAIPCPLLIFDPRYWLMIRRVLESGSRRFGMVACERDRTYSDHGTVLEVCDCVHLEDGRSILSTVGVSRFKVIERDVIDGCDVARIEPLTDIAPTEDFVIWELRLMATQISYKALLWLRGMDRAVRAEIEAAFGRLPRCDPRDDWWGSPDGPAWLWWLIAILPLRSEIKVLILSTKSLLKRMMAVARTLEAIDQIALNAAGAPSECALQSAFAHAHAHAHAHTDWTDADADAHS